MASTICHFEIPADDLQAAGEFYGALFGWSVAPAGPDYMLIRTSEQPGALGGALFRRSGPAAEGEVPRGVTLYAVVESVEEAASKLEKLGGKVLSPKAAVPGMGWTAVGQDPQGNAIGLFQRDEGAA